MSWTKLVEDGSAPRQNRFVGSEDSLQFSDNKLAKRSLEDSLNYFGVGFNTPLKKSLIVEKSEIFIDSNEMAEILQLINQANLKIQELERRLGDKPKGTDASVQTDPTQQMKCLRKIVERLNRE